MQAPMRTQYASLIPLFMRADEALRVKEEMDDNCEAVVIGEDQPKVVFSGLAKKLSVQYLDHISMVHL